MKKIRGFFLFLIMFVSLSIALCGCKGDKSSAETSSITIGIPQDIEDSLDPHKAKAAGTKEVLFNVYEGLVKPDSDGNFIPAVANNYVIEEDGKKYTFKLRESVMFHDGSIVTAEDVKYSIERCADANDETTFVPAYSNLKSVDILDESTIQITLEQKDTEFLAYMTTAIIPKKNNEPDIKSIGTGPYQFVSRTPQEKIQFKKFDSYWGPAAMIESVVFKIVSNSDMVVLNLNGGSIDMYARLTQTQANELNESFEVYEGTMNLVQALYINNDVAPFNDIQVRQAMCYAVDKKEIQDLIFDGRGQEIASSMFPAFSKYYSKELNQAYETDIEKAKSLLTNAGYPDGFSFTITVPSNYQPHIDTAQVLVEQYKEIGLKPTIELVEWSTWLSEVYTNRNYETTVIGVDASNLTARALLERFKSDASNNFVNFSSVAYDKALEQAILSVDEEEKILAYKDCERILSEEAANVYIQDMPELVAISKKYIGYEFYPLYVQDISKLRILED